MSQRSRNEIPEDVEIIGPELQPKEVIAAVPALVRLIFRLVRDPRVPLRRKLFLGAVALYLAVPIDIVPDMIPVVGHLDDVLLIVLALEKLVVDTDDEILFDSWDGDPSVLARILYKLRESPGDFGKKLRRRRPNREDGP